MSKWIINRKIYSNHIKNKLLRYVGFLNMLFRECIFFLKFLSQSSSFRYYLYLVYFFDNPSYCSIGSVFILLLKRDSWFSRRSTSCNPWLFNLWFIINYYKLSFSPLFSRLLYNFLGFYYDLLRILLRESSLFSQFPL